MTVDRDYGIDPVLIVFSEDEHLFNKYYLHENRQWVLSPDPNPNRIHTLKLGESPHITPAKVRELILKYLSEK